MMGKVSRLNLSPDRLNNFIDKARDLTLGFAPIVHGLTISHPNVAYSVGFGFIGLGWVFNSFKRDRVVPALTAIALRVNQIESTYLKKEEAGDLLAFALARIAEQPDPARRERTTRVLCNVVEKPKDHETNKRLARLADEIADNDRKVLETVAGLGDTAEVVARWQAARVVTGLPNSGVFWCIEALKREGLIHGEGIYGLLLPGQEPNDTTRFIVTEFGKTLLSYWAEWATKASAEARS